MSAGLSAYLNALRFVAALIVVISHFAYARYSGGSLLWIRELNLGSDAVILFFVLSGFVIAYSADRKDPTLGTFLFSRATRLYSVMIPAVLIGFALDRVGAQLAPEAYAGWWYAPQSLGATLVIGLGFANEWTGQGVRLGTNGPLWSLSYEVAYYLMFAAAIYLRGAARWLALVAGGLAFGLNVLLLAPAWLAGVWLYNRLPRLAALRRPRMHMALPVALYALALASGLPDTLRAATVAWIGPEAVAGLRFSDEFLWNALIGGLFAWHLAGAAAVLTDRAPWRPALCALLASGSFSIYVMHYPAMQALDALLPWAETAGRAGLVLLLTLGFCAGFAMLFERPLPHFRTWLQRFRAHPAQHATPRDPGPAPAR